MKPTLMLAVALLLGAAACSEKPQRVLIEPETVAAPENRDGEMRERTLQQGEAGRMAY